MIKFFIWGVPEESISEESIPEESIPEESIPEESIPEESIPEESIPEKPLRNLFQLKLILSYLCLGDGQSPDLPTSWEIS